MNTTEMTGMLYEVGTRIRALREIAGYSVVYMAQQTGIDVETYMLYEAGEADLPFTFIHNCARIFGVGSFEPCVPRGRYALYPDGFCGLYG